MCTVNIINMLLFNFVASYEGLFSASFALSSGKYSSQLKESLCINFIDDPSH